MTRSWPATGRSVIVTAAAAGIGRAIAERFVANGDRVTGVDVNFDGMAEMGLAAWIAGDVADPAIVKEALSSARLAAGRIDILVCCAGYSVASPIPNLSLDDWDGMMALNLRGPFLMAKYGIPMLRESGGGVMINIASQLGLVAAEGQAAYCASKGGLIQLTRGLALDHGREGIRVNAVCPGPTKSETMLSFLASAPDPLEVEARLASRTAMNRLLDTQEIAGCALFLASPDATGVTGHTLVVDAGYIIA